MVSNLSSSINMSNNKIEEDFKLMQNVAGNERQSFWKKFSGGIKVPHTLVIIFSIIILMAIATYIVPGGAYERVATEVNGQTRTVV